MPPHSILRRHSPKLHALAACLLLSTGAAQAQALKYTLTNPHFGGSPFNGAELMASAAAQKDIKSSSFGATGLLGVEISVITVRNVLPNCGEAKIPTFNGDRAKADDVCGVGFESVFKK